MLLMNVIHVAGHCAITMLLMDKLKETAETTGIEGRIMFMGSEAQSITYDAPIHFNVVSVSQFMMWLS